MTTNNPSPTRAVLAILIILAYLSGVFYLIHSFDTKELTVSIIRLVGGLYLLSWLVTVVIHKLPK